MNIGTPTEPTISGLRTYLKEFLSDPDVIDVHPILRWLIVNLLVVPFRPHRILHQYQSVWMKEGSPLMVNSKNFVDKISLKNQSKLKSTLQKHFQYLCFYFFYFYIEKLHRYILR